MRTTSTATLAFALTTSLGVSLLTPAIPSAAVTVPAADQVLRRADGRAGDNLHLVRQSRAARIASCLDNARDTARDMMNDCQRKHPVRKDGNAPGRQDCTDFVYDWLLGEQRACRAIR